MSQAAHAMGIVLSELGFDGDPEMAETSERFTEFLSEWDPRGSAPTPSIVATTTETPVIVRDMPFYSLCAHHLLPFFGTATVAYHPREKLVGLGFIPSLLKYYARQPQIQERIADQVVDALQDAIAPRGVVVRLVARHMCVEMRGSRTPAEVEVLATRGELDASLLRRVCSV